jgi:hypothetical protein
VFADDQVLRKREVAFVPYVNGWALQRPYRMDGISLYDRLAQVESGKTAALRQWADNLENLNNARAGLVEGQVRISEWISRQPGGYVTIKSPDAIVPLVSADLGPSSQAFLDYQDKMRSERGGASLDLQSAEAQIAGHTAHGTERQYTAREQLAALMARNFAETLIRGVYMLTHRVLRTSGMGELELKRNGEWQRSDPREWAERSRLMVNLGLTATERDRRAAALREVIGLQTQAMQAGFEGVLVDPIGIYTAAIELAEAAGLPAPERFYVDPRSPQAQEAMQSKAEQQEQQQAEAEQLRQEMLGLTLEHERYQHDTELRFKYFDALLDAETKEETTEAELVGGAALELAKQAQASTADE